MDKESYESEDFFKQCLSDVFDSNEINDEDNTKVLADADEHYIVLDRVYNDVLDPHTNGVHYQTLKSECRSKLQGYNDFSYMTASKFVRYIQCYESELANSCVVKSMITTDKNFMMNVSVHGRPVTGSHEIWNRIPRHCFTRKLVKLTLDVIAKYCICP
ncbi:hypothetical protein ACF0H5_018587 [Mactra antiquata]